MNEQLNVQPTISIPASASASPEDIIKLKAEIFDILRQQDMYMTNANNLRQKRIEKTQELRNLEQNGDEIIKIKAQIFDIINQQDEYISAANNLQQLKMQKLQSLNDMEYHIPQKPITPKTNL